MCLLFLLKGKNEGTKNDKWEGAVIWVSVREVRHIVVSAGVCMRPTAFFDGGVDDLLTNTLVWPLCWWPGLYGLV